MRKSKIIAVLSCSLGMMLLSCSAHSGSNSSSVSPASSAGSSLIASSVPVKQYDIRFLDEDGSVLQSSKWDFGALPVYSGKTPAKAKDAQYSYAFSGWTPEITAVTAAADYTAVYEKTVNIYTIRFVDEDGTELKSAVLEYGAMPKAPADPTKKGTAQYTYAFTGWSPAIAAVTGNATYTATYSSALNQYTITFKDEDGNVLQTGKWDYASLPTCPEPSKEKDAQYTYTFAGWTPAVAQVTGDAVYTATYSSVINHYTVTFYDEDGTTVLDSKEWSYGSTPFLSGDQPTKEPDDYTYVFSGWSPAIVPVTEAASYTAQYNKYSTGFTFLLNEDGVSYSLTKYVGTVTSLIIPDAFNGLPVNAIAADVFSGNTTLTSVDIPDSITSIGANAFKDCTKLKTIVLPSQLTVISDDLFSGCSTLATVTLPSSLTAIGKEAFLNCDRLTSSFVLPSALTSLGTAVFQGCKTLGNVTLPSSITSIPAHLFDSCTQLTSVTLPDSITSIGDYAFCNCNVLKISTVPASVLSIGSHAFESCWAITSFTVPTSVTSLGASAFAYCKGLTEAYVLGKISTLGDYTFRTCPLLTTVTLPTTLTVIGTEAFRDDGVLTAPAFPSTLVTIGDGAFRECVALKSIILPDSLLSIGETAFYDCYNLALVYGDVDLTSLGRYAFCKCSSLITFELASTIQTIGDCALSGTSISSIEIGTAITSMGSNVFSNCTLLTKIVCNFVAKPASWPTDWNGSSATVVWA
jgi:hypothetical protein